MASLVNDLLVDPHTLNGVPYSQVTSGNVFVAQPSPIPGAALPPNYQLITTDFLRSSYAPVPAPRIIQYADGSTFNQETGQVVGPDGSVLTVVNTNLNGTWVLSDGSTLDPILGTRIAQDGTAIQLDPSFRLPGNFSQLADDIGGISDKVNNFGVGLISIFEGPQTTVPGTQLQGSNLSAKGTGVFVVASLVIIFLLLRG